MARFGEYKEGAGASNMRLDEKILDFCIETKQTTPTLRFYGWSPSCVSLGRNQKTEGINFDFCKKNNIDVVRRITGGRALLHQHEITYSFVSSTSFLRDGEGVLSSYSEISEALIFGLKMFGIEAGFSQNNKIKAKDNYCMALNTGADLSVDGKKIIGSAQVRKEGYILQHGSLLIDVDKQVLQNIFNEKVDEEKITWLKKIKKNIDKNKLLFCLKSGFEEKFNQKFNEKLF